MTARRPRILVVDDEPLNQELIEAMLIPLGYDVDLADDGQACLDRVSRMPPDTILLDVMMPGINGFQVCRRLKTSPRTQHIPVVMVTALRDVEHRVEALESGADDFLSKPVDKLELRTRVRSCLRMKAARDRERRLLNDTLNGAIRTLTEIVSATDQPAFSEALAVRDLASQVARALELPDRWEIELAAMLAPIGMVTLPPEVRQRASQHKRLKPSEQHMLQQVPKVSQELVARIPRLQKVAAIIDHLSPGYFGWRATRSNTSERPMGTQVLELCKDLLHWQKTGLTRVAALRRMASQEDRTDQELLDRLLVTLPDYDPRKLGPSEVARFVRVAELKTGDTLMCDVVTPERRMLISAGHVVTSIVRNRLINFSKTVGVLQPLQVKRVVDEAELEAIQANNAPLRYVVGE